MAEYIDRDDAIDKIIECVGEDKADYLEGVLHLVPTADVVGRKVLDQVYWERDTALHQLAEIGKGLGEKMDDVVERKHGKWKYQTMVHESGIKANGVACSICGATYNLSITLPDMMVEALNFCPNCGSDNRGEKDG